jgi:hypothetical protein
VLLNVTAVTPTAGTYVTVFPTDVERPTASNLNAVTGQVVPNMVIARLGPDGAATDLQQQRHRRPRGRRDGLLHQLSRRAPGCRRRRQPGSLRSMATTLDPARRAALNTDAPRRARSATQGGAPTEVRSGRSAGVPA